MSKRVYVAALAVLPLLFAMPAAAQDEPVKLVVWDHLADLTADPNAPDPMQTIYDQFMAENPDVVIQREVIQAQEMENVVPTALASGEGPDVVYYDLTPARELFSGGLLLPLDTYADQYGWKDRLTESEQRVPLLGSIPLLGNLFKVRNTQKTKTNLMVFIRPRVLRTAEQAAIETNTKYNYVRGLQLEQNNGKVELMPGEGRPALPPVIGPVAPPTAAAPESLPPPDTAAAPSGPGK